MTDWLVHARAADLITFDCYGTLIDWSAGIRRALAQLLATAKIDWSEQLFDSYLALEAKHESLAYQPYRQILTAAEHDLLQVAGATTDGPAVLAQSIGEWPPFDDTLGALERLASRFRLGILSNIDRDLFALTAKQLKAHLDPVITAEDVRSYKPATAHFTRLLELTRLPKRKLLHVAQSLYHDVTPCNQLGIACVWINRRGEHNRTAARPCAEFKSLADLADALLEPASLPADRTRSSSI